MAEHMYTVIERVYPQPEGSAAPTPGCLLGAFKMIADANNFATSHANEVEHEVKLDITLDVEQHVLRTTGTRVRAELTKDRTTLWCQKWSNNGMLWGKPDDETRLRLRQVLLTDLFPRRYYEFPKEKLLWDRKERQSTVPRGGLQTVTIESMKTALVHEAVVQEVRVKDQVMNPPRKQDCVLCDTKGR